MLINPGLRSTEDDLPRERAAIESQLRHQLSAALDQGFILHDPLHPEFRVLDQHNQFGLVNPDNRYLIASICTPGTYVIRGKRGNSADLQIEVGGGTPGFDDTVNLEPICQLTKKELVVDDDGNFEIVVSRTRKGDNWLSNTKDGVCATSILIRESFMDWENEVGSTWSIERVDTRGVRSPVRDQALVDQQYARAAAYLTASTRGWVDFVAGLASKLRPGIMSPPGGKATTPCLVSGTPPASSSSARIRRSSSGSRSRRLATSPFRSATCGSTASITAGAMVVDFDALRDHLPPDEPHFSACERAAQLAARKAASLVNPRRF